MSSAFPSGLCGVGGCVFTKNHRGHHSWEPPYQNPKKGKKP